MWRGRARDGPVGVRELHGELFERGEGERGRLADGVAVALHEVVARRRLARLARAKDAEPQLVGDRK